MRIDRAAPSDLPRVAELLTAQLTEHAMPPDPARLDSALRRVLQEPALGAVLVARDETLAVIGVAYVAFTWSLEHGGKVAWLDELYVDPARRERGVGRELLGAVLDLAREAGARAVDLEVDRDHARVMTLYERHDFRALPRTRMVRRM